MNWGAVENYWDSSFPDFKTISDFKWCIECGTEIEIEWKGFYFGIVHYGKGNKITVYLWNQPGTEQVFNTADDALEYMVASDRLRNVITQVTVLECTI